MMGARVVKTLIIIPAYNEEKSISRVVENIINNYPEYDYIVVNDGSTDGTAKICIEKGYNFLDLPINLGLSGAFRAGIKYAYKCGFDAAIQFDADGQHRAEYIKAMEEELKKGYDIIIGSRFLSGKKPKSARMLGNNLISFAIMLTTGKKIKDPTSGMRMFNKDMIKKFALNINYDPEPDTIAYLIRRGAKVSEVQVKMDERLDGKSYLNFSNSVKYMLRVGISIMLIQFFRKKD